MDYLQILKDNWGYNSFRGIQADIIKSIGDGHDTLGLMPTGGGKSICFQVPALAADGLCIVITPLISLMRDQVSHLRQKGIKATAVYSGMSREETDRAYDNCIYGDYKFLYVSPERIGAESFQQRLRHIRRVCMITVDEAHCVSQWGYDFRPSYLKIAELRHIIPYHVPILALTATATPRVVDDIQERLEFGQKNVIAMSFERKNLAYIVRTTSDKTRETLGILQKVKHGSVIVYTRSRRLTSELAKILNQKGITATNYHAGLNPTEKNHRQADWSNGNIRVMVATNAFGMGIDKSDVRLVIHYNLPESIESYFQEAGRAGRDGMKAYAVLLYNPADKAIMKRRIADKYPEPEYIRRIYEDVCHFLAVGMGEGYQHIYDFSLDKFCIFFKHFPVVANSALHILTNAGYIDFQEENDFRSRLKFTLQKEELYHINSDDTRTDTILHAILRNYTGLFADYVGIDEIYLAYNTGYTPEAIYNTLKELSSRGIITYIPRRNTPTIQFLTPRIEPDDIVLTPQVYDDRKADYADRINQLLTYVSSTNRCRSEMLLEYFGEKQAQPCGVCDVCIAQRSKPTAAQTDRIRKEILRQLADCQPHEPHTLKPDSCSQELFRQVVSQMLDEEEIMQEGRMIRINKQPNNQTDK